MTLCPKWLHLGDSNGIPAEGTSQPFGGGAIGHALDQLAAKGLAKEEVEGFVIEAEMDGASAQKRTARSFAL